MKQTNTTETWEEKFEKWMKDHSGIMGGLGSNMIPDLIDYIYTIRQEAIEEERERMVEFIKGQKREKVTFPEGVNMNMPYNQMLMGYENALSDLLTFLSKEEKE